MKKILIIEASPRKGFCSKVAADLSENLNAAFTCELLTLSKLTIHQCKGCAVCFSIGSSKCPFRSDDTLMVLEKLNWADGVIYVVPNYALGAPALLKNLFDRLAYVFHRPRLFHKQCLPIVVQGVYGGKKIASYINEAMGFWGMTENKGVVVTGGIYPNQEKCFQISPKDQQSVQEAIKKFKTELYKEKVQQPSLFKLMIFRMTRNSMKYSNEVLLPDKEYYLKKGWLEAAYYYDVKLNPLKSILGHIFDIMARNMIAKGSKG